MKIYSEFYLDEYPDAQKIVDWIPTVETCSNDTYYRFRIPQSKKEDNWFRNLQLLSVDEKLFSVYHIAYEKKHEYYIVEIDDTSDALKTFLKQFEGNQGLVYQDGELWLEIMGD